MLLTEERRKALKRAGYTTWIEFDIYLPIAEVWTRTGFPTTPDAIEAHRESLGRRSEHREIKEVSVEAL